MIKVSHFGPVTRFDLARTMAGRGRYWTSAYFVGGMLVNEEETIPGLGQEIRAMDLPEPWCGRGLHGLSGLSGR